MIFNLLRRVRLSRANKAVAAAREAYVDATMRRDSRDQHHAHRALVDAQAVRLRIEIGHRPGRMAVRG